VRLAAHNLKLTWRQQYLQQQQQRRRRQQQHRGQLQADPDELLSQPCPCDDLVDWALQRLLQLELLEMQPVDTDLVLQLLSFAKHNLLDTLAKQQQQQQQQHAHVVLLQHVTQMLAGFTALQQGMAAHPAAVRSKARFAQHEQQLLQAEWDRFTLDWDHCLDELNCMPPELLLLMFATLSGARMPCSCKVGECRSSRMHDNQQHQSKRVWMV
jgi:hypothetical protein